MDLIQLFAPIKCLRHRVMDETSQRMRRWIMCEAAHHFGSTFWFNPLTREEIPCGDHGDRVAQDPSKFGIDYHIEQQMMAATPKQSMDDEDDQEPDDMLHGPVDGVWGADGGWYVNDAWEQLAMNQGWVRVGLGSRSYATYVSSSNAKSVWIAIAYLVKQGVMIEKLEIEISREQNSLFVILLDDDIARFVRVGGRNAEPFLARLK